MNVSFEMKDEFLAGDYDSRIQNDVLLYIFKDDKLIHARNIPYEAIAGGVDYPISKTPEMVGNLKLVAWAVKAGETHVGSNDRLTSHHPRRNPEYNMGDDYNSLFLAHTPFETARADGDNTYHEPHHHERYLGTLNPTEDERWDRHSHHDVILTPAPGRVVVNIKDPGNYLASKGSAPYVVVEGGMSHMELGEPKHGRTGRNGYGQQVLVRADINAIPGGTRAEGDTTHSTGMFGVLPTLANSSLTVHIKNGDDNIGTYTITSQNTEGKFTALHSGDLIQFDYDLTSSEVVITINGYTIKDVNPPL